MPDPAAIDSVAHPSWAFRIAFGIAAVVAAILLAFFFIGLADGSVSSFNIGLWLGMLLGVGGILFGARMLRTRGHVKAALALLALLALPGLLYAVFIVLFVASGVRWN